MTGILYSFNLIRTQTENIVYQSGGGNQNRKRMLLAYQQQESERF